MTHAECYTYRTSAPKTDNISLPEQMAPKDNNTFFATRIVQAKRFLVCNQVLQYKG